MSLRSGTRSRRRCGSFIGRWATTQAGAVRGADLPERALRCLRRGPQAGRPLRDPQGSGGIVDCSTRRRDHRNEAAREADRLAGHRAQALDYWHHSDDPAAVSPRRASSSSARSNASRSGSLAGSPRHRLTASISPSCQIATRRSTSRGRGAALPRASPEAHDRCCNRRQPPLRTPLGSGLADEIARSATSSSSSSGASSREPRLLGGDPVEQIVEALIADPRRSSAAELGHLFSVLATTDQSARGGSIMGALRERGLFASPARSAPRSRRAGRSSSKRLGSTGATSTRRSSARS